MSDPSLPVQKAMVGAMTAASIAGGRIYDQAPTAAQFPYVTVGDCQVVPDKADCIDGAEIFPQVDVWSRATGFPETKQIAAQVLAALDDKPLVVDGYHLTVFEFVDVRYVRDPDGITRHGILNFHGLLHPL
jgi:Protein of unknown function (DUF3168)